MITFDASRLLPLMSASILCRILACVFLGIGIYKMRKQKKNGEESRGIPIQITIGVLLLLLGIGISYYIRTNL